MSQAVVTAVGAIGAAASGLVFFSSKKKLKAELAAIECDLTQTENEKFDALDQVDELQQTVSELQKTFNATKAESAAAIDQRAAKDSANSKLFAEKLKTVNDVNVRLKAELQTYQSQLGKLQTELNSKQDELDDVNAQRDIANDTLRDVVQEKEKLFKELKDAKENAEKADMAKETPSPHPSTNGVTQPPDQRFQPVAQEDSARMGAPQMGGPQMASPQLGAPQTGAPQMGGSKLDAMQKIRNDMAHVKTRLQTEQLSSTEHTKLMGQVASMSQAMQALMRQSEGATGNGNGHPGTDPTPISMGQLQGGLMVGGQQGMQQLQQQQQQQQPQQQGMQQQQPNQMQQPYQQQQQPQQQQHQHQQQQQQPQQQQQYQPQMMQQQQYQQQMMQQQQQQQMMQQQQQQQMMQQQQQRQSKSASMSALPHENRRGSQEFSRNTRGSMDRSDSRGSVGGTLSAKRTSIDAPQNRRASQEGRNGNSSGNRRGSMDRGSVGNGSQVKKSVGIHTEKSSWGDEFSKESGASKKKEARKSVSKGGGKCVACRVEDAKNDDGTCNLCKSGK